MKIKCVTGAPCSGKSTYVSKNMKRGDIKFDFDLFTKAISNNKSDQEATAEQVEFVNKMRYSFIRISRDIESDNNSWIIACKPSDALREVLGDDCEYIEINKTKDEVLKQLDESDRPNKDIEREKIEKYFEDRSMPIKEDREYRNRGEFASNENHNVEGYASTFQPYEMMEIDGEKYYERIDPHAFDGADMSDVVFLRDHTGRVLARTKNGAIELSVDENGLFTKTNLGLTEASRAMYEDIKAGNYTQMSFSFIVAEDHFDRPTRTRVIDRIKKVFDISAVGFPANPGTNIGLSMRDYFDGEIEMEKAERLEREKRETERKRLELRIKLERSK